jgi:tetratricopeptide (TPR) repeat protein
MPAAACQKPPEPSEDASSIAQLPPDPEYDAKMAKEAAYQSHLAAGTKALEARQYDAAIEHLTHAVVEKPLGPEAHVGLGRAYVAKKEDAAALKAYSAALNGSERGIDALMERAAIYTRLGRLDDAVADYRAVIAIGTDRAVTARAYWLRGGIVDQLGNRAEYREFCERAMELEPSYKAQITGGDILVNNMSDALVALRIDLIVNLDGSERTFPPEVRFTVRGKTSAYLKYKNELLSARSVQYTIVNKAGMKEFTATYKNGMSLEIPIGEDDLPR